MMHSGLGLGVVTAGIGLCLAALVGCGSAPGAGAEPDDQVGSVLLELQQGPADARCLRLTVDNPVTAQKVVRALALTPGVTSKFAVTGLPLGAVGILGEAFNVACANIAATTPFTWTSDRVPVSLSPDLTPSLSLVLHKAAKANIGVDFVAGLQFEEVPANGATYDIASAPDGSVVFTVPGSLSIWRASSGINAVQIAALPSAPRFIATASNGAIVVTTDANQLVVLTAAGVITATLPIPFDASDLAIDTAQTAWVGSFSSPQLLRVPAIGTANPPVATPVPLPGLLQVGIGVAADGLRVVSANQPRMLSLSPAGVITFDRPIPLPLRDVTVASDQSVWGFSALNRQMFQFPVGGAPPLQFFVPGGGGGLDTTGLISTTKGVFLAIGTSQIFQFNPGLSAVIQVPSSNSIAGLAASLDGRLWVTDQGVAHVVAVTLP